MALTFTAGQLVTANELNLLVPVFVIKAANQVVTNSATLVNDNDITFTLLANQTYHIAFHAIAQSSIATTPWPGIKFQWNGTGTVTQTTNHVWGPAVGTAGTAPIASSYQIEAGTVGLGASGGYGTGTAPIVIKNDLILLGGASGGTVQLQFAQATAGGAAVTTTLLAGTFAIARVIA